VGAVVEHIMQLLTFFLQQVA